MKQVSFGKDEVIFVEGSYGETMYEITSGKVGIYAKYGSEGQTLLATLGEGEIFGEMGLVEFWARSATAVALEDDTQANEVGSDEFMSYLQDQPDKVLSIMRQLSARLRETNQKYEEACHTVFEAIEAEKANKRRSRGLRARLSGMIAQLRRSDG